VEGSGLTCQSVKIPLKEFSSKSGLRVGITPVQLSKIVRAKIPADGPLCSDYEISSSEGLLVQDKKREQLKEFTDSTGVVGTMEKGKVVWLAPYGISSN
jgi:hypothetical protein